MSDLHAQLLAATEPLLPGVVLRTGNVGAPLAALRAVVELHAPDPDSRRVVCRTCNRLSGGRQDVRRSAPWPCSTIQVIAYQLGVDG